MSQFQKQQPSSPTLKGKGSWFHYRYYWIYHHEKQVISKSLESRKEYYYFNQIPNHYMKSQMLLFSHSLWEFILSNAIFLQLIAL